MKRLGLLLLGTACATATPTPPVTPVAADPLACPQERSTTTGSLDAVIGKRVEIVCLVGGHPELRNAVADLEGRPLDAARIGTVLRDLFASGLVHDADVVATPVDAGRVVLTWFITPYTRITAVRVSGAQSVGGDGFTQVTSERFAYASPGTLRALRDAVQESLAERGYPHATVQVAMAQTEALVSVVEGAREDVTRIRFVGVKKAKEAKLREVLLSREGAVYLADAAARDVMQLESFYQDYGMVRASVKSSYEAGELLFTVDEGDVYKVGSLKLTGTPVTDPAKLLASLSSKRGATFSRGALVRDIEHIRAHASVTVTLLTELDNKKRAVDVTFELAPAPAQPPSATP